MRIPGEVGGSFRGIESRAVLDGAVFEPVIACHLGATPLPSTPAEIRCRDVVVRFGEVEVLRGIDATFRAGEIVSLIGSSGCGKTTLLRAIAGLVPTASGELSIDPPARGRGGELAFVFQQPTLLPWRTSVENVALSIQLTGLQLTGLGVGKREALARAADELSAMELPREAFGRFPRELSGGMRMRVSLARALVTRPSVLLLDEPFAALDDMSRGALGDLLLRRWDARPFTAVLVTHNIAEAVLLSHRIFVMGRGRIGDGIIDELPRPRDESVRVSSRFGELYGRVSAELRRVAAEGVADVAMPVGGPRR